MSTKEQGKRSGGVRTIEGKAITRYNAQKHAILRESISEYEKADYEQIFNDLAHDLRPDGYLQEKMVEVMAASLVRLQRISKAESEQIREIMSPVKMESLSDSDRYEMYFLNEDKRPSLPKAYTATLSVESLERLDLYSRYQTASENRLYRAIMVFKQLKSYG